MNNKNDHTLLKDHPVFPIIPLSEDFDLCFFSRNKYKLKMGYLLLFHHVNETIW